MKKIIAREFLYFLGTILFLALVYGCFFVSAVAGVRASNKNVFFTLLSACLQKFANSDKATWFNVLF